MFKTSLTNMSKKLFTCKINNIFPCIYHSYIQLKQFISGKSNNIIIIAKMQHLCIPILRICEKNYDKHNRIEHQLFIHTYTHIHINTNMWTDNKSNKMKKKELYMKYSFSFYVRWVFYPHVENNFSVVQVFLCVYDLDVRNLQ